MCQNKPKLPLVHSISLLLCAAGGLVALLRISPLLTRIAGIICLVALPVMAFTSVKMLLAAKQEK